MLITDWARSGMTQEDRAIGEPEAEAVVKRRLTKKEPPCNETILERCTSPLCWQIPNSGQRLKSSEEKGQYDLRLL